MVKSLLVFLGLFLLMVGLLLYLSDHYPNLFFLWFILLLVFSHLLGGRVQPLLNMYPSKVIAEKKIMREGRSYRFVLEEITRTPTSRYNPVTVTVHDYRSVCIDEKGKRSSVKHLGQDEKIAKKKFQEMV